MKTKALLNLVLSLWNAIKLLKAIKQPLEMGKQSVQLLED